MSWRKLQKLQENSRKFEKSDWSKKVKICNKNLLSGEAHVELVGQLAVSRPSTNSFKWGENFPQPYSKLTSALWTSNATLDFEHR